MILARDLLARLRDGELADIGRKLAIESGHEHRSASGGVDVRGVYRRSVILASGRFAMLNDDVDAPLDTAVYDISAHLVVLPDRTRLEAHSGLGDHVDDPRYVRERMRGPMPPALYELAAD